MRSAPRWLLTALVMLIGVLAVGSASATASTVDDPSGTTATPTATATTVPEASAVPETSAPDSSPESTMPATSSPADTLIAAGEPDDSIDTTTATIAVVGFVLLVALASWWMVRRNDPDSEPMPRTPSQSPPPSDLI